MGTFRQLPAPAKLAFAVILLGFVSAFAGLAWVALLSAHVAGGLTPTGFFLMTTGGATVAVGGLAWLQRTDLTSTPEGMTI